MSSHMTKKPKLDDNPKSATGDQLKRQGPRQGADAMKQKKHEGGKRTENTKIRNKRGVVTTDSTDIKRSIKQHYEQLYVDN